MERHKFNTRNQRAGETIDSYISDLKIKAKSCNFGDLCQELFQDRMFCGINNDNMRKVLLHDSDLTLAKAISICQIHEVTEEHNKTLSYPQHSATKVDAFQAKLTGKRKHETKMRYQAEKYGTACTDSCDNCGGSHPAKKDKCPSLVSNVIHAKSVITLEDAASPNNGHTTGRSLGGGFISCYLTKLITPQIRHFKSTG